LEFAGRIAIQLVRNINLCPHDRFKGFDERFNCSRVAFSHHFNSAVGKIAHESRHVERCGNTASRVPETHALHATGEIHGSSNHRHTAEATAETGQTQPAAGCFERLTLGGERRRFVRCYSAAERRRQIPADGFEEVETMKTALFRSALLALVSSCGVSAQTTWDVLEDFDSDSVCGLVNAINASNGGPIELVILSDSGELMIVSRTDTILGGTFVDIDNFVFIDGQPSGVIEFATDGDGFRTVWWLALDGSVVEFDPFTAQVTPGVTFPEDFTNVACDACEFVDLPPAGICDTVPVDPGVDLPGVIAPIIINACGAGASSALTLMMVGCGLVGLRRTGRRA